MSALAAAEFIRLMILREMKTVNDTEGAIARISRMYGIGCYQIEHLRRKRAKTVKMDLFSKIRGAYLDHCRKQIKKIEHEIMTLEAAGSHDSFEDLLNKVSALAQDIEKAKKMNEGRYD